mmetsp:Transcript_100436/g.287455  ORF Transcript_100436/g.287455 Transcript_100436/m.287455 type:complete len:259 (-) Transcript_100436:1113-1889(-)
MSSSGISSRYLTIPRIELPCAATSTVFCLLRAGMIDPSQNGRHRSTVSLRHSESGISSSGMCAYLLSLPGQYSEVVSISGGGVEYERRHSPTCSAPYFSTVCFLSNPVSPPYMRSLRRQLALTGTSSWPVILRAISRVCCARVRSEVKATSTLRPSCHIWVAPMAASFLPRVVRGTSAQPVKRLASFHSDCPCLRKMRVVYGSSAALSTVRLDARIGAAREKPRLGRKAAAGASSASARTRTRIVKVDEEEMRVTSSL